MRACVDRPSFSGTEVPRLLESWSYIADTTPADGIVVLRMRFDV
jgi:hypothetical protein